MFKKIPLLISLLFLFTFQFQNAFAIQTDTEYIPADKYFETALTEINFAKVSIYLVMYLVSVNPNQPEAQPSQLLNALVKAKDRGVDVKVILDQNINFESDSLDEAVLTNKNQQSYEFLKRSGVPVFFDESQTFTHSKTLIIDNKTVLLGSTNWSKSALTRNHETNLLVRSEELAKNISQDLDRIKLQENVPAILTPSVPISKDFVTDRKLLGKMASSSDERAFDSYLYFLKEFDQNKESTIILDYDNLAKSLGIDKMSPEDYRRQISKVLDKLQGKYKSISFDKPGRNQNTTIKLQQTQNAEDSQNIQLPSSYFKFEWNKALSFPAKVMLLVNLYHSQNSPDGRFSISRETLSKTYGLSESFISDGNTELKKLNLLDIEYGSFENNNFSKRQPSIYTPQNLYDPKELDDKLKSLASKHGQEKFQRALDIAKVVFEERNLRTIQTLMDLEDQYGPQIIDEASKKISEKSLDNPRRTAGYLINMIKGMAKETQGVGR